jgi:cell wall-associated NlpC family hydrolase
MEFGICLLGFASLRERPDHKSEMVSQLLFGELFEILETRNGWHHVMMHLDSYQGWVAANQATILEFEEYQVLKACPPLFTGELIGLMEDKTRQGSFAVSAGCPVYFAERDSLSFAGRVFSYKGQLHQPPASPSADEATSLAMLFLNTPYLWGGRSVFGMDCSGFVQQVYRMTGIRLPRDASVQATLGETVHLIHEARPGDLLFFDNHEEEINHVGMLLNEGFIIHSHGKVRIDMVDHNGIYNRETKRYTHRLRLLKRLIKPSDQ